MKLVIDVGTSLYDEHERGYVVKALRKDSKRYYYTCASIDCQEKDYIFIVPKWEWNSKTQCEKEVLILTKKTKKRLRKLLKTT